MPSVTLQLALIMSLSTGSAVSLAAQAAPSVTQAVSQADRATLMHEREAVWVHWFSGDTAALRRALAPELVAIGGDSGHWQSLTESMAASASFHAGGGRFVAVQFDETTLHLFGETVVMFSHYAVETERAGVRSTQRGRATEVFVRHDGRWVHTSWHLDTAPSREGGHAASPTADRDTRP